MISNIYELIMRSYLTTRFTFIHPGTVCMSYIQHFWFSMSLAQRFAVGSIKAVIHAFLPDYYITSSSDLIKEITDDMGKVGCKEHEVDDELDPMVMAAY